MNKRSRFKLVILSILIFLCIKLNAQNPVSENKPIEISDFAPMHKFLSSDWMEGRETGEKGSFIASDYIASMMEVYGIEPYGDTREPSTFDKNNRLYFQTFEVIKYKTETASLALVSQNKDSRVVTQFSLGIDFEVQAACKSISGEGNIVFAGYGINAPEIGYDDYKKLNVDGRVVMIMDGFPGFKNEKSTSYNKFLSGTSEAKTSKEAKLKSAMSHGAIGVILINASNPIKNATINTAFLKMTMNTDKFIDPDYDDYDFTLPDEEENKNIPLFKISQEVARELLNGSGINLKEIETKTEQNLISYSQELRKSLAFSVTVNSQAIAVRNVLGIIPGKDRTKNIIIGAHYDHLGIRDGQIYNGSDDNASGTTGMLTLLKYWKNKSETPPVNLIFAAWAAEEKGHWGSIFFANKFDCNPQNTLLNINFDMISRSASEDITGLTLSVGTMKRDEDLRTLSTKNNLLLEKPFSLDLWDTATGGGSDYATFDRRDISVMTFFSGFHDDYHSFRDISFYADYGKMKAILNLANSCLKDFIETIN